MSQPCSVKQCQEEADVNQRVFSMCPGPCAPAEQINSFSLPLLPQHFHLPKALDSTGQLGGAGGVKMERSKGHRAPRLPAPAPRGSAGFGFANNIYRRHQRTSTRHHRCGTAPSSPGTRLALLSPTKARRDTSISHGAAHRPIKRDTGEPNP